MAPPAISPKQWMLGLPGHNEVMRLEDVLLLLKGAIHEFNLLLATGFARGDNASLLLLLLGQGHPFDRGNIFFFLIKYDYKMI